MKFQKFRNLLTLKLRIEGVKAMAQRTRDGGAEIVNFLKANGYYTAGASLVQMAETIILDKKRLLPCSLHLTGQHGIDDLYIGGCRRDSRNRIDR